MIHESFESFSRWDDRQLIIGCGCQTKRQTGDYVSNVMNDRSEGHVSSWILFMIKMQILSRLVACLFKLLPSSLSQLFEQSRRSNEQVVAKGAYHG